MAGRFTGRVAIVTGAARGIGAAIAGRLAGEGAGVAVADLRADAATQTAVKLGPDALGIACDVADETQVESCVASVLQHFGRLDVIVNNAGFMSFKPMSDWTSADWIKLLQIDLIGAAMFTREAFRHMGDKGGSIINISSIHAQRTSPLVAPYAAAKAAMLSLTRTSAIEGRARGIRANAVLPGAIDTPMLWDNPNVKSGAEVIDRNDVGSPEDVAAATAFLASDDAKFITGTTLAVDGGRLTKL